jgi:hypothetical protein
MHVSIASRVCLGAVVSSSSSLGPGHFQVGIILQVVIGAIIMARMSSGRPSDK